MTRRTISVLAALAAALTLAIATGGASANRLSLSNTSIRWAFARYTSVNAEIVISCELTLEGSFHSRTLAKTRGLLLGYITRVAVRTPCSGAGDMRFLTETLPWHIRYQSFAGTLPNISSVTVDVIGWSWNYPGIGGLPCLYRSTAAGPARWIMNTEAGGGVTGVRADEAIAVPLSEGPFYCAETINYRGTGTMTLLGTTSAIFIRLI